MKKKVAISACLTGQAVRYDGSSKYHQSIMDYLARHVELLPFCPEVAIGLPVPREKIHLCYDKKQLRIKQVDNYQNDYTDQLSQYAREFISQNPDLSAAIFKSRSPSCGLGSTPIIKNNHQLGLGSGQFAYIIKTEYSSILMVEESALQTQKQCEQFLLQLT